MAKRKNDNLNMKEALSAFIQKNNLQGGMDKIDVKTAWSRLMGNGVNNYTTDVELRNGTLFVALKNWERNW